METSSIVLGLLLLILFVGPMLYLAFRQSSKEKKRRKKLEIFSQKSQLNLSESEFQPCVSIGIDSASQKLVAIQQVDPKKEILLDLREIKKVRLQKLDAKMVPTESIDDTREISLLFKTEGGVEEKIDFYRYEEDSVMERESLLKIANKWQQLVLENSK